MAVRHICIDDVTDRRLKQAMRETGRSVEELIEAAAAEAALTYFRHRKDDPA